MTNIEFSKRINEKRNQIHTLKREIEVMKANHIQEHKRFDLGEKVEVVTKEHRSVSFSRELIPETKRFAFVKSFNVHTDGSISTDLYKCRKDGKVSSHNDYLVQEYQINKIK